MNSIGQVLAAEREKRDKSIQDVERALKIRAKYIEALEADDFEAIPGDAYVSGFIKVYCEMLGLDPAPLLETYRNTHEKPELSMPQPVMPARREHPRFPKALWVGLLLLAALAFSAWVGMSLVSALKPSTPAPEQTTTTVVAEPTKTVQPAKVAPRSRAKRPRAFTIKVVATDSNWLLARVDGRAAFNDTLETGQSLRWRARKTIVLRSDAPEVFKVWRNGRYAGLLGKGFTLQTRTFKAVVK